MILRKYIKIVFFTVLISLSVLNVYASDTMLMFVGEDLDVLSIASRKEESAWSAPAIAKVITYNDILDSGALTIAQVIDDTPGFHIEKTNKGTIPYLRGIPNSTLILFDTVPIGSGAEKFNHLSDYETSLVSIKRIEIIRGAGSVLWGPDAFAGVVNAVPWTGKDFSGTETGITLSSADKGKQAFIKYGKDNDLFATFFSLSARHAVEDDTTTNTIAFWDGGAVPSPVDQRFGSSEPDDSNYLDLYGNILFSDWLVFSVKLSESSRAFSVTDWEKDYIWEEQEANNSKMFKFEASKDIGIASGIRLTGYYSDSELEQTFIDLSFKQKEYSIFGELIYELSLFSSDALLTVGTSYKEDHFDDILLWDSYFPGYLVPENQYFFPEFQQKDYENNLLSVFSQYRHKIRDIEFWGGFRNDNHDEFENKISFSSGVAWSVSPEIIVKTTYGSGYRTPFAKQVNENSSNSLEQIKSINLQLQYKPVKTSLFSLTVFRNDIEDHVVGDRYEGAGVSLPNNQTIDGVELEWKFKAGNKLSFFGNATFLDNDGPAEIFMYNDYTYIDEEGNEQKHYQILAHNYDTGSDILLNLSSVWEIKDNIHLIAQVEYFSERELYYSVGNEIKKYPEAWLCNLRLNFKNIKSCDIDLYVNNIFNNRFETFDAASDHSDESINAGITIRYHW